MKKNIIFLSVIIILSALSFYLLKKPVKTTEDFDGKILKIDSAAVIEVSFEKNGKKILLSKGLNRWQIKEPGNFEPEPAAVQTMLQFINDIELKNIISEKQDKFSKFGVDSTGTIISVRKQDNSSISYIIGSDDRDRNYSFYRVHNDSRIYLGTIFPRYRLSSDVKMWRDRLIVKENPDNISYLSVRSKSGNFSAERVQNVWKAVLNGDSVTADTEKIQKTLTKLSSFRASDFNDSLKSNDVVPEVVVNYKSSSSDIGEVVLFKHHDSFLAFVKEKDQVYVITENDYKTFEDLTKK
ncbi:MAG TPA: DUF4340 domain-containing protein [Clostridiales bacterium]|nr:DUF4340 domain-containing protein [Clostridiales bacterium]HQP69451.1 DUF4340 domain-containing protein [Clostridiales bacterium]